MKSVVIIGAGFGGLKAAKALAKNKEIKITLIDRRNYHLFQPLLYQVATAGLSPADIAAPIRAIVSEHSNIEVIYGNVVDIDKENQKVITQDKTYIYDYLIMACGAKHSYFGKDEWEENAPGLKTLEQATEIRRRILLAFELAEKEVDLEKRKTLQTFVIVGGGPTGVELAGSIAEISRYTLEEDFRNIDPSRTRVILIEAGNRILAAFDEDLSKKAARDLENLGVQIWTSTRVTDVTTEGVKLADEFIKAKTVIWAAGVQPSSLSKKLNTPLDRQGRIVVTKNLNIEQYPNIFVIGDQACFQTTDGKTLPGLAPVAMQQGKHAAKNILAALNNEDLKAFEYLDKGMMATIGRKKAIVQVGKIKFNGFFAWAAWLFIHVFYLIGFKNKLFVLSEWAWSYLTFKRGARLIVDKEWRTSSSTPKESP
ncbi:MAG: NAD(P)/FAD-dependent oxidoreductase [Pseudobdellovibrio sp.]